MNRELDEVLIGKTINASLCDTKECNAVHLNIGDSNGKMICSCALPIEDAEELITLLEAAIKKRRNPENKAMRQ